MTPPGEYGSGGGDARLIALDSIGARCLRYARRPLKLGAWTVSRAFATATLLCCCRPSAPLGSATEDSASTPSPVVAVHDAEARDAGTVQAPAVFSAESHCEALKKIDHALPRFSEITEHDAGPLAFDIHGARGTVVPSGFESCEVDTWDRVRTPGATYRCVSRASSSSEEASRILKDLESVWKTCLQGPWRKSPRLSVWHAPPSRRGFVRSCGLSVGSDRRVTMSCGEGVPD